MNKWKIIWFSIGFGVLYWIVDSVIDVLAFSKGTLYAHIFFPEPIEIGMRLLAMLVIIAFALFAQITISKRKKAEESLILTSEALTSIINASPLAIMTLDINRNVTSWNPASEL